MLLRGTEGRRGKGRSFPRTIGCVGALEGGREEAGLEGRPRARGGRSCCWLWLKGVAVAVDNAERGSPGGDEVLGAGELVIVL